MTKTTEQSDTISQQPDEVESISTDKIRTVVGELYYSQFSILLGLTAAYYVIVAIRDIVSPPLEMAGLLHLSNAIVLGFLFVTYVLEKRGTINQSNIYLTPIPIAIAMVVNVHCHVMVTADTSILLRGLLLIVAFGIVSLLPWIFWLLVTISGLFYIISAYVLLGADSGTYIVLGVGAMMVSYGGFAVRHNSVREQIRLTLINKERAEKLEQLSRAKDEFVANMSHELRTPLTGLMGMVDLLADAPLRAQDKHHLMTAKASAETLRVIINDILDLSKLGAGKIKLIEAPFHIGLLASDVAEMMHVAAAAKNVGLALKLPSEDLPIVIGDQARLRQILFNLTGNAVKFTQAGEIIVSLIVLSASEGKVAVRFQVEDSGVGIAQEDMGRLFDRFEQIDSSMTRSQSGTGLGLAISQELAHLMSSVIEVESTFGEGSRFWFDIVLPIAEDQSIGTNEAKTKTRENRNAFLAQSMKVLVAEDNAVNQMLIKKLLEKSAWDTVFVDDGIEAIKMAQEKSFDFILMDIQMPNMSGDKAAAEIRAQKGVNQDTPILALTANCMPEDVARYQTSGINDVIAKPIQLDVFYDTIMRHVSGE